MVTESDLQLRDGRTLRMYDSGVGAAEPSLTVYWLHGTPQVGEPPAPLLPETERRGIRVVSHDRPGYGGSTTQRGRDVAAVVADVTAVVDALGVDQFAVVGASGGGTHALACAALLPERVLGVVSAAGLAPFDAQDLDWFAGMAAFGQAELRAASGGRDLLAAHLATVGDFNPEQFTDADHKFLAGPWSWLGGSSRRALADGPDGMLDDDVAYVTPWGFDPETIGAPVLFLHGAQDRVVPSAHSSWLSQRCRWAELWLRPDDGHLSVLSRCPAALDWLGEHAKRN
ncbi:MAG TPA: alpha/beta fold hydrolase [Pseudonocardiaceae bacterium]|nr:alpha/beta fold hydrolase [Pseudonocardiaceae bacterium]